jgi:hypothetical protein
MTMTYCGVSQLPLLFARRTTETPVVLLVFDLPWLLNAVDVAAGECAAFLRVEGLD